MGGETTEKKIKASLRRAGNARGLSMGFFRMQNCRLAHSIEEREGAAAGFQLRCRRRRRCRRGSCSPWVPAAHHWALGGRAGGRQGGGQAQSQCRIADFSCAGFFFFLICGVTLDPAFHVTKMSPEKGNALTMGSGASTRKP